MIAPHFPDTVIKRNERFAYVFANDVFVRADPSKKSKALGKVSRSFVCVDTYALCYDDIDENWLPILDASGKRAYIFMDFTSWSKRHGYVQVERDQKGNLHVVRLTWKRAPVGTWHLPGCC
jgi:hypothetical protein